MSRKRTKEVFKDTYHIFPSADGVNYAWFVYEYNGTSLLANGKASNFDTAFRAVRNFMKNNQELVYGSNSQPIAA